MRAIILAAGRGSRMGDLTNDSPKSCIPLAGKPMIEYQIDAMQQAGIKNIAVVTGYQSKYLKDYGTYHFHNSLWQETNMVYSLICAMPWLEHYDCIVSYADIIYTKNIINALIQNTNPISIAYDPHWLALWKKRFSDPLDDAESFKFDNDHILTDIGQKASTTDEIQGQYMGLLKFKQNTFFELIKPFANNVPKSISMTELLSQAIANGQKIKVIANHEPWFEADSKSDVSVYNQ